MEHSSPAATTSLTERYTAAVDLARTMHAGDVRKGTTIPYLAHVLAVSSIVLEHGGDEDTAIAALLHDLAEDHGGDDQLKAIEARFGAAVAAIVRSCSDDLPPPGAPKQPWRLRKDRYIDHIADASDGAALVTAADKLHNVRALLSDHHAHRSAVWSRFNPAAGRAGTLWYYRRVATEVTNRLSARPGATLAQELTAAVELLIEQVCRLEGVSRAVLDAEHASFDSVR